MYVRSKTNSYSWCSIRYFFESLIFSHEKVITRNNLSFIWIVKIPTKKCVLQYFPLPIDKISFLKTDAITENITIVLLFVCVPNSWEIFSNCFTYRKHIWNKIHSIILSLQSSISSKIIHSVKLDCLINENVVLLTIFSSKIGSMTNYLSLSCLFFTDNRLND